MPSIEELEIDFKSGRIKEPEIDPSEEYFSTVGSSTGEFAEYVKKEKTMAKKKQPKQPKKVEQPAKSVATIKKGIPRTTTSLAVVGIRPYTQAEKKALKAQYPEQDIDVSALQSVFFDSHLTFQNSQEAEA